MTLINLKQTSKQTGMSRFPLLSKRLIVPVITTIDLSILIDPTGSVPGE